MQGWEQQVAETARRYQQLREKLAQLSITEASGDGAVKVTIAASGLLTDLVLRERWRPEPLPDIAAEIMDCVRRAQAKIPDLLRQAMSDTIGEQDPGTHLLLSEARQRFPEQEPQEPRPARTTQPVSKGDWDEREFLEQL
jgi:DNA-binding protein YbaB